MVFCMAVSAVEVFKWIGYFIVALLCLMLMIMLHELGHYTFGKIFKFKINEFSIGFGPKIFSKTNSKTGEVFSIRCIPLGGYCAFAGEDEEVPEEKDIPEGEDASKYDHYFNKRPVWQRIIVLFAGAGFNFISALIVITIFFSAYGEYFPVVGNVYQHVEYNEDGSYEVIEGSQKLQEGDIIYSVNGKYCYSLLEFNKLNQLVAQSDVLDLVVIRDGEKINIQLEKNYYLTYETNDESGEDTEIISQNKGVGMSLATFSVQKLPFGRAIAHGFTFGYDILRVTFSTLGQVFTGSVAVSDSLGGTATAIYSLAQLVQAGIPAIIYGFCLLSVSIGIMNILPLPALDGSRIVFAIIEGIRKKPVNRKVEGMIHFVGIIVLFALAIILDLLHFFG